MTDRQIADVCFHPRDEETGQLLTPPGPAPVIREELTLAEAEELFFGFGRSAGVEEEQLQAAWAVKKKAWEEAERGSAGH